MSTVKCCFAVNQEVEVLWRKEPENKSTAKLKTTLIHAAFFRSAALSGSVQRLFIMNRYNRLYCSGWRTDSQSYNYGQADCPHLTSTHEPLQRSQPPVDSFFTECASYFITCSGWFLLLFCSPSLLCSFCFPVGQPTFSPVQFDEERCTMTFIQKVCLIFQ